MLSGVGLLGVGIGGGALLLMMIDYVVRLLGKFARLHYALLNTQRRLGGAHVQTLGWIATVGLGIGVVSLALAYAVGGRDLDAARSQHLPCPVVRRWQSRCEQRNAV